MPKVGVVLVGHGRSASALLEAARGVCGERALAGVLAVDAGRGETEALKLRLHDALAAVDQGGEVLMVVDAYGASPCACGIREASVAPVVLSGLSFNVLLKLASLDRAALSAEELARACADSARRSVAVHLPPPPAPAKEST